MSHLNQEKHTIKTESSDLISMLTRYWDQNSISKPTRQVYLDLFKNLTDDKLSKFVEYELKSFSKNSSLLLILIQSIETREQSFSSIRDMDQYLREVKGWEKKIEVITECAEMLQTHRMITLSCVENIVNWIIQIYYFTGHTCTYTHKNKSYVEKILKDSKFHQFAEMAKFFRFSIQTDPFLLALADQISLKIDSNLSNFFIKSKKFSIPVPFALSFRISQMQMFIANGELTPEVLEDKKKNFQSLIENSLGVIKKNKKRREGALLKSLMAQMIDELICDDVWIIAKTQTNTKLAKIILLRFLDLTKTIKNIVKEAIKESNDKKKTKSSINSEKIKSKHELIKNEETKNDLKNASLNSPESTRPSFAFSLLDGESLMNKLMAVTNTIKGKPSPPVSKKNDYAPASLKFIDTKELNQEEMKVGFEFAPNTKSMKYRIKNEVETPKVHKSKHFNETRHESSIRNKNVLEKHSETILNKSLQIKTKSISSNSTAKAKVSDLTKLEPLRQLNIRPTFLNTSKTPIKLAPIPRQMVRSPSPTEENKPKPTENLKKAPKTKKNKKFDLFSSIIVEGIYRNLLETLIKESKLSKIAEDSIKSSISSNPSQISSMSSFEQSLIIWKLQTKVYNSLIESFLSSSWLIDLVTLIKDYSGSPGRSRLNSVELSETFRDMFVEEPEDYIHEVFTPKIHSPNVVLSRIQSISEHSEKSEQNSLRDSKANFNALKVVSQSLQLIVSSLADMKVTIGKYLAELGNEAKRNSTDLKTMFELAETGEDLCWFRFGDGNSLKGMAGVCCVWHGGRRTGMVFHVSSKDWTEIGQMVEELLGFLRAQGFESAVFKFGRIEEGVRRIAENKGMKVHRENKEMWMDLNTQSNSTTSVNINHSIKTSTSANVLVGFKEPCTTMIEFSSHPLLSSHMLSLLSDPSSFQPTQSPVRLQSDLGDLLSLQISQHLPALSSSRPSNLFHTSNFSLSFHYTCMSRSFLQISKQTYASLTFHQSTYCKTDHFSIYFVKTSKPNIEVAFIVYPGIYKELVSDMRLIKTDVFSKAENILQSGQERKSFNKELCVPAFAKQIDWEVNWAKGFDLAEAGLIASCEEKVTWDWRVNEGIVNSVKESASFKVTEEFIVVVVDLQVLELLYVPVCAALVREKDWIKIA